MTLNFNYRPRPATNRVILHSSRTGPEVKDIVSHLRVKGRENGLLDIGYHYVIALDGHVTETRDPRTVGSHAPGFNHDSLGICLEGGGTAYPGPAVVEALAELLAALGLSGADAPPVLGHSEVQRFKGREPCPAYNLNQLREDLANMLTNGLPKVDALPPMSKEEGKAASLTPQNTLVLDYLKSGRALTNLIAITNLGVGSLSSRVAQLRTLGYHIFSDRKKDFNSRAYFSYSLRPDQVNTPEVVAEKAVEDELATGVE